MSSNKVMLTFFLSKSTTTAAAAVAVVVVVVLLVVTATATPATSSSLLSSSSTSLSKPTSTNLIIKRVQVQIIHRHGDRTPITPLKDEMYWMNQLIPQSTIQNIASGTVLVRDEDEQEHDDSIDNNCRVEQQKQQQHKPKEHPARGRGPFGKLTSLGLYQMIALGNRLREEFVCCENNNDSNNENDNFSKATLDHHGRIFYPYLWNTNDNKNNNKLPIISTDDIRVYSTDFERTIQSVQGVLLGLLSSSSSKNNDNDDNDADGDLVKDNNNKIKNMIPIDVRYTNIMIPDPHPRYTNEQVILEKELMKRLHIRMKEMELLPFAIQVTKALHPFLANDAHEAEFGTPQEKTTLTTRKSPSGSTSTILLNDNRNVVRDDEDDNNDTDLESIEIEPLSWNQLAEVTKCLSCRNLLPETISIHDCEMIANHAAWKWFQSWRHPRLAYLSMNKLVQKQLYIMVQYINSTKKTTTIPVQANDNDANRYTVTTATATATTTTDTVKNNNNDSPVVVQEPPPQQQQPKLTIWSAHDSTLIGLLCAYRLQQPAVWPEYGSYLMIELLHITQQPNDSDNTSTSSDEHGDNNCHDDDDDNYFVRFSLNGEIVKCTWDDADADADDHHYDENYNAKSTSDTTEGDEAGMEMIRLSTLLEKMNRSIPYYKTQASSSSLL